MTDSFKSKFNLLWPVAVSLLAVGIAWGSLSTKVENVDIQRLLDKSLYMDDRTRDLNAITARLDRIENKLDRLVEK